LDSLAVDPIAAPPPSPAIAPDVVRPIATLDAAQPIVRQTGAQQQLQLAALGDLVWMDEVMGEVWVSAMAQARAPAAPVPHAAPTPTTDQRDDAYLDRLVVHLDGSELEPECSARYTEYMRITQAEYRAHHTRKGGAGGGPSRPRRKPRKFHPLIRKCKAYVPSTARCTLARQRKRQQQQ
jgi:hypothetical protein